eukprot:jgi/Mesvir1/14247/Mv25155-RA.1
MCHLVDASYPHHCNVPPGGCFISTPLQCATWWMLHIHTTAMCHLVDASYPHHCNVPPGGCFGAATWCSVQGCKPGITRE